MPGRPRTEVRCPDDEERERSSEDKEGSSERENKGGNAIAGEEKGKNVFSNYNKKDTKNVDIDCREPVNS